MVVTEEFEAHLKAEHYLGGPHVIARMEYDSSDEKDTQKAIANAIVASSAPTALTHLKRCVAAANKLPLAAFLGLGAPEYPFLEAEKFLRKIKRSKR